MKKNYDYISLFVDKEMYRLVDSKMGRWKMLNKLIYRFIDRQTGWWIYRLA